MKRLLFLLPLLALISVCVYFIVTTSPLVRFWVDDFCAAIPVRNGGFWGAQVGWWITWTGRYSYIAFLDVFELLGPWSVKFIPLLLFPLLIIPLISVFSFEIILAPVFVILTLINAPNLIQSFYWQTGSFNYTAEYIFLNFFFLLLVKAKSKWMVLTSFILLFIAGGFSEAYAATQIVIVGIILLILLIGNFENKSLKIKLAISGIVGGLLSLFVMSLSPGNDVRASIATQPSSLMFVVKSTFYGTKWYLERMLLVKPFLISLILSASIIFIVVNNKWKIFQKLFFGTNRTLVIMFLSILIAICSTAAVIFTGYYATAYTPPERTMSIAIYSIFVGFFIFCFAASIQLNKILSKKITKYLVWLAFLLSFVSSGFLVNSTISHWGKIRGEMSTYIQAWEPQEKILVGASENGEETATIENVQSVGQLDDFVQNKNWVLGCLRAYYNLKEIKLK